MGCRAFDATADPPLGAIIHIGMCDRGVKGHVEYAPQVLNTGVVPLASTSTVPVRVVGLVVERAAQDQVTLQLGC